MIKSIKAAVKRLARSFGFEIYWIPRSADSHVTHEYAPVIPSATLVLGIRTACFSKYMLLFGDTHWLINIGVTSFGN